MISSVISWVSFKGDMLGFSRNQLLLHGDASQVWLGLTPGLPGSGFHCCFLGGQVDRD